MRFNDNLKLRLVLMAFDLYMDLILVHGASPVLEATKAYSLNSAGTPVIVVEMCVWHGALI
ncbi:MAG: hypothetical protein PUI29_08530 [Aeromonadales bacterium]|nr:hypothetical protein [Aeromonadales bacterium]MDY2890204.1 hypothetical protein [Succinivibrio sp.]